MSIAQNYPIIAPSMSMDFANVQALDPRITFARATTATYYGTRTALAEQNLVLQSQAFETTWTTSNLTVTANTTAAPDGTTTADSIIPTTAANTTHRVIQTVTLSVAPSVFSVYVKANGYTKVGIREVSVAGYYATFNLSAVTVLDSTLCTGSIVDAGNGWYRVTLSFTAVAGANIWSIFPLDDSYTTGSPTAYTYTANGTSGIFLWGAQLEQRSTVTAYTPTTTQPITNYVPVLETAASGVARFDHNPVTFESLGLLIEELRTNLLLRSEEFDNAVWTKGNTTITANTAIAPDGNLTADKAIVNSGAQASVGVYQDVTALSASTAYTVSAFVKKAGAQYAVIGWIYTGAVYAAVAYDLDTLTVSRSSSAGGFTITGNSITSVGNGWYRITITATVPSTGALGRFPCVFPRNTAWTSGNPDGADTGDGYAGIFIWGAQLE